VSGVADPRTLLVRNGVADARLAGRQAFVAYRQAEPSTVTRPSAAIHAEPSATAEPVDQLLFGEGFDVLSREGRWAFGQARRDGYVGWVGADALAQGAPRPTHRVSASRTVALAEPGVRAAAATWLPLNALVRVEGSEGGFARAAGAGWIPRAHLAPLGEVEADPATVALRFLGAPYAWGGRDGLGLDCSGLVQAALFACGRACPRDSDQQAALGSAVAPEALRRNDLVFWRGHVGLMLDEARLIHATAHVMAVVVEPLAEVVARRERLGEGLPTGCRRLAPA
jgi:cell wall-associated NlpC family hydrolase